MTRLLRLTVALALPVVLTTGCEPTCAATCDKLVECEDVETPRMSSTVCEESCATQELLYQGWEDTQLEDAFAEYKRCVRGSTCGEIAAGVCYDEDIYLY